MDAVKNPNQSCQSAAAVVELFELFMMTLCVVLLGDGNVGNFLTQVTVTQPVWAIRDNGTDKEK